MNVERLVGGLSQVTEGLADLMLRENDALAARRPSQLVATQDEKERLSRLYEQQMRTLRQNPEVLAQASPELRERLRDIAMRFQAILGEHRRRVQAAKAISERMLQAISDQVARRERTVSGYDARALIDPVLGGRQQAVSLALNQVV